jgi:hypothetical protein
MAMQFLMRRMLHPPTLRCQIKLTINIIKLKLKIQRMDQELGVGEGAGGVRTKMIGSCAVTPFPS